MGSAILTSPPTAMARLVVDTDVASFVFKWHPQFAPRYVAMVRGAELVVSFMTMAEMRQGAWMQTGDRESGTFWRRTCPTSRCFIPTAFYAPPGLPFETRALARDVR